MYPISMKRRHRRLRDAPRPLPEVRWVEVDFTVPVRSGPSARVRQEQGAIFPLENPAPETKAPAENPVLKRQMSVFPRWGFTP